jgi:hypothetical protein
MPLIRGRHSFDNNFTQIPNAWLRDSRLSFRARGFLAMLLSHSQGWSLSIASIVAESREGTHAIRETIYELENLGYLERSQTNENGRFGESVWETKDPQPMSDFPPSENPLVKNNNIKNTNKNIKNNNQELFDEFWKEYPQKKDKGAAFKAFRSALNRAKFEEILAGVIRYKNDPTRDAKFTKYPATWLNADAWENHYQSPDDSALRRRELEQTRSMEFLAEMEKMAEKSAPAPKCKHGNNAIICKICN